MANESLKAIAASIKNGDVSTILPTDPEVFMAHADLFGFVKDYYTNYGTVPAPAIIKSETGVILPDEVGDTESTLR